MRAARFFVLCLVTMAACAKRCSNDSVLPIERPGRARRVRLQDVSLHTLEVGSTQGPLRIVVHGGPGLDHTYLRPWLDPLGQHARLLYIDLRGHGRSDPPPDVQGYTISAAAADLAGLIAARGNDEPADVLGHDFGGSVALELAARHPERVRKLILVNPLRDPRQIATVARISREQLGEIGWQQVQALTTPQGTLRDPHRVTDLFRVLGPMWWFQRPSEAVLARMGRDLIYHPEADEHFLADAAVWDGLSRAREVRAPTLVLAGAADRTFPPADSRALADILPHGQYAEITEAGHCPFIERPERFVAVVESFFEPWAQQE